MAEIQTKKAQKRVESDTRIIQAAARIFGNLGYGQTTLTAIAEEAGVSQGLVSQRFGSKEALLQEVFDQTNILSFYDESNQHLPSTFYVLLEHLKKEAVEEPEWFRFLSMIHTGQDTPQSFEKHTQEMFERTPLHSAIVEAQEQGDLPACDPWDIFRVFFRNATNLIGWYHEFGLPMPDNDYFLYAIQYNRKEREREAMLQSQKFEINTLLTDRDILFTAVSDIYPLIIFNNLSRNTYYMLEYEHFTTKQAKSEGVYDDLIRIGASTIPDDIHRQQFLRMFSRDNVISAYENGKQQLCLRHLQNGDDGVTRWIETRMLFKGCECGEILAVAMSKPIDDEIERLRSYGEALQNAELAAGAKTRFLTNLSYDIRTPMNSIVGLTELISKRADDPEKVRGYAKKLRVSEDELMDMLSHALEAANISAKGSGIETKIDLYEGSGNIIANARRLAEHRGVVLDYQVGELTDDYIYADEILLQRIAMSLILKAINESSSGDPILVKLEQMENDESDIVKLCFSVYSKRMGMSTETENRIPNDMYETDDPVMNFAQVQEDVRELGGTLDLKADTDGTLIVCNFGFRRAK